MKFIDLFCGIGGFHQGLKGLGECVLASEIDPHAQEVYYNNFGIVPVGDIRQLNFIPEHDLLCAGFPCQAFSLAGKRQGFSEDRGLLFFEIVRILRKAKPKAFLLENVEGLLWHDEGRTFARVLKELKPYHVHWKVLDAFDFGVPQHRKRIFIVGFLDDVEFSFPVSKAKPRVITDILEEGIEGERFRYCDRIPENIPEKGKIPLLNCRGVRHPKGKQYQSDYLIRSSEPSPCLLHSIFGVTKTLKVIYPECRYLTGREVARIQGFPDSFKLHENRNRVYEQMGNSVCPVVVRAIGRSLLF